MNHKLVIEPLPIDYQHAYRWLLVVDGEVVAWDYALTRFGARRAARIAKRELEEQL